MDELRSIKTYSDLSTLSLNDQTKFRLKEINKIKDYFEFQIREKEAVIKKLSKYTAALDYTDKTLIVLSATSGGISDFFYKCYWNPCRSNKCKPYFNAFFNYSNNEETIKGNKKKRIKNIVKLLCLLTVN